jgi:hypothetical protein
MESNLTAPLLSDNNSMPSSDWPKAEAERAKLYIPDNCDPYQGEGEPRKCMLKFDAERKVLVLVAQDTEEILEVINPEDVIGAAVEVELLGSAANSEPRATTFRNETSPAEGPSSPADCGIFRPLGDDTEKIFSFCNNEPASEIPFDTQAKAILTLYVYPRVDPSKKSFFDSCGPGKITPNKDYPVATEDDSSSTKLLHRYAHHRKFQVAPAEDFADISILVKGIRELCRPSAKTECLLVLVNPFSGRKLGEQVYQTVVAPMLEQAGVEHDHIITTHAQHAEERMMQQPKDSGISDITEYDGLVAVGGDGMFHELLQGIRKRSDSDKILKTLKLGHIGAGTSNGLSMSLAHASEVKL